METQTAKPDKTTNASPTPTSLAQWSMGLVLLIAAVAAAAWYHKQLLPHLNAWLNPDAEIEADDHAGHDHSGHDHAGHDEGNSLELSAQARKNIGLKTAQVKLETFVRTASVPAIVIGRPGRAQIEVTATMGGRVTRVYPIEGEAVEPGQPLFDLRLTHEELVRAQSDLLRSAEELDVEVREIRRLETIVESGAVAGKRLLERQYEQGKIQAAINAQQQSLLLHGLSQEQVDSIMQDRKLVQSVTVLAPARPSHRADDADKYPFTVRTLSVRPGQYVDAGASLCLLMDYGQLYIQGRAFEQEAAELIEAAREGWGIRALPENSRKDVQPINGLKIVYVDNEVEADSRALHFYVNLPNRIVNESTSDDGHRFFTWQFKPGQRMQLLVPMERWDERIVLPIDAVAKDGVEYYVFQQNSDHFDRVPVQVEYQDQFFTVIANDGTIYPGDTVAMSGAAQLQMALKNKSGGAVDPHAGHNH
ncbi:efflux RND transporter periplasmic adaptor subunit [Lignipirellula cremea]|uniref:Copper/silver efflux system membrane fusion protein CusB n=1 Tax=Lignipirellula cremea TaxID=2528010 RepID=A0A518DTD6_9BACT|nr:efflux RND transporter periplasmic adaptor subunit [Lignipirellula cremea]QDU95058.1 copper/silver efflux system membrane fusion protein CusB [Lignipirellula cremea]